MSINPEGMLLGIDQEHRVHHIRRDQHIFILNQPNQWKNLLHLHLQSQSFGL